MQILNLIYDKINEVIGGTSENQFFTLMLPGTLLNKADFTSGTKAKIAIQESNLVHGLLDLAQVVPSHNGRKLFRQYESALSALLPKLDPQVETWRKGLRQMLDQQIEVTIDGNKASMKKLDYFNRLVDQYDQAVADWEGQQHKKRDSLLADPNIKDATKREDAFDAWYSDNYRATEAKIQHAYQQTTAVLSPDEQTLIDRVLGSGDTSLMDAAEILRSAPVQYPQGVAYPVEFTPGNWPNLLDSDFAYVDLLASPEAVANKLDVQQQIVQDSIDRLNALTVNMPTDLQSDLDALTQAQSAYQDAQDSLLTTYTRNAATAVKIYLSKTQSKKDDQASKTKNVNGILGGLEKDSPSSDADEGKTGRGGTLTDDDVNKIMDGQKTLIAAQSKVQATGLNMADAANKVGRDEAEYMDLHIYVDKLAAALKQVVALRKQLDITANVPSDSVINKIYPDAKSEAFTEALVTFQKQDMSDQSTLTTSFSQTSWSVDLFFGSASGTKSKQQTDFTHDVMSDSTDFQIGMLLAKVEIDRSWFDPGIFDRTQDMHRIGATPISHGPLKPEQFKNANSTILPTFPTAFVIAKDITIKIAIEAGKTSQASHVLDTHESESGGFLCFSVSHVAADHEESKVFSSHVEGTNVVIRIPAPQIIGWYQEFVPLDQSTELTDVDEASLSGFLSSYQRVVAGAAGQQNLRQAV